MTQNMMITEHGGQLINPSNGLGHRSMARRCTPMNATQLVDLVRAAIGGGGGAGYIEAANRFHLGQQVGGEPTHIHGQRALAAALTDAANAAAERYARADKTGGANPLRGAHAHPKRLPGGAVEYVALGVGDIAWLDRLSTDPTKVTASDVQHLVAMEANAEPGSSDRRLVEARLNPLRQYWGRKQAESEIAILSATKPTMPSAVTKAATAALAEALRLELPEELTDREVVARAAEAVAQIERDIADQHTERLDDARRRLQEINEGSAA